MRAVLEHVGGNGRWWQVLVRAEESHLPAVAAYGLDILRVHSPDVGLVEVHVGVGGGRPDSEDRIVDACVEVDVVAHVCCVAEHHELEHVAGLPLLCGAEPLVVDRSGLFDSCTALVEEVSAINCGEVGAGGANADGAGVCSERVRAGDARG